MLTPHETTGGFHCTGLPIHTMKSGKTSASRFDTIHLLHVKAVDRIILKQPLALPTGVNEPGLPVEHPALRQAEVDQEGRLVAVQAEQRGCSPPGRLQRRPGDAVRLDRPPSRSPTKCRVLPSSRPALLDVPAVATFFQ